jgi:hypothetical protein
VSGFLKSVKTMKMEKIWSELPVMYMPIAFMGSCFAGAMASSQAFFSLSLSRSAGEGALRVVAVAFEDLSFYCSVSGSCASCLSCSLVAYLDKGRRKPGRIRQTTRLWLRRRRCREVDNPLGRRRCRGIRSFSHDGQMCCGDGDGVVDER